MVARATTRCHGMSAAASRLLVGCGRRACNLRSLDHPRSPLALQRLLSSMASSDSSSHSLAPPSPLRPPPSPPPRPSRQSSGLPTVRRQYAFEFPSPSADPSAAASSFIAAAAAARSSSDRCTNKHYVAFVQRQQPATARSKQRDSLLPPTAAPSSHSSQPHLQPQSLADSSLTYPRPLPAIYSSTSTTALPSPQLNTVPLRVYNAFIWLLCATTALYIVLEYEDRRPVHRSSSTSGRGSSGARVGQRTGDEAHFLTPLRKRWKELKLSWKQPAAAVERGESGMQLAGAIRSTSSPADK